jgi:hypothetical protein
MTTVENVDEIENENDSESSSSGSESDSESSDAEGQEDGNVDGNFNRRLEKDGGETGTYKVVGFFIYHYFFLFCLYIFISTYFFPHYISSTPFSILFHLLF